VGEFLSIEKIGRGKEKGKRGITRRNQKKKKKQRIKETIRGKRKSKR